MVTESFCVGKGNIILISEEIQEWADGSGIKKLNEYKDTSDNNILFSSTDKFGITKDEITAEDVIAVFDKFSSVTYQVENIFNVSDRFCLEDVNEDSFLSNGYLRLLHLLYYIKNKNAEEKPFDILLKYYFDGLHEGIIGQLSVYLMKHFNNIRTLYILDNHAETIKDVIELYTRTGRI